MFQRYPHSLVSCGAEGSGKDEKMTQAELDFDWGSIQFAEAAYFRSDISYHLANGMLR